MFTGSESYRRLFWLSSTGRHSSTYGREPAWHYEHQCARCVTLQTIWAAVAGLRCRQIASPILIRLPLGASLPLVRRPGFRRPMGRGHRAIRLADLGWFLMSNHVHWLVVPRGRGRRQGARTGPLSPCPNIRDPPAGCARRTSPVRRRTGSSPLRQANPRCLRISRNRRCFSGLLP